VNGHLVITILQAFVAKMSGCMLFISWLHVIKVF